MPRHKVCFSALLLLAGLTAGCRNDGPTSPLYSNSLSISMSGLADLGDGWGYEGWLIIDGSPVSTGAFVVDDSGNLSQDVFPMDSSSLFKATRFVVTIERRPDTDPAPSSTHVLAGPFINNVAELTVGDEAAIGNDFRDAKGTYILDTPSTASVTTDWRAGIWWLLPETVEGAVASLELPTLANGWMYQGWVDGPHGPVPTGKFLSATGHDSDMGGSAAGPDPTPAFPGQDFIIPSAANLVGYRAFISIEPEPDTNILPYNLQPLDDRVDDVGRGISQSMANRSGSFPTGTASR